MKASIIVPLHTLENKKRQLVDNYEAIFRKTQVVT